MASKIIMDHPTNQTQNVKTGIAARIANLQAAQKKDETISKSSNSSSHTNNSSKNSRGKISSKIAAMQQQSMNQIKQDHPRPAPIKQNSLSHLGTRKPNNQKLNKLASKLNGINLTRRPPPFRSLSDVGAVSIGNVINHSEEYDNKDSNGDGHITLHHAVQLRATVCGLRTRKRQLPSLDLIKFSSEI